MSAGAAVALMLAGVLLFTVASEMEWRGRQVSALVLFLTALAAGIAIAWMKNDDLAVLLFLLALVGEAVFMLTC